MLIGYNEATAMKKSTLELDLQFTEKYGFDYIEIRMDKLKEYLGSHTLTELNTFFNNNRIKPYALNALEYFNLKPEQQFRKVKQEFESMCSIGDEINCRIVVVVPSPNPENRSDEEVKKNTVECLMDFSNIAMKYRIKVALEFLGVPRISINTLARCYEIVQEVNLDNVGLVLDCFHFYANGSSLKDLKNIEANKIFCFHINDSEDYPIGTLTDANRLWPGEGVVPLKEILNTLKQIGFNKVATIELFNPQYWEWDVEKTIRTAKQKTGKVLLKYFENKTGGEENE